MNRDLKQCLRAAAPSVQWLPSRLEAACATAWLQSGLGKALWSAQWRRNRLGASFLQRLVALQEAPRSLLERPKAPKPARSSRLSAQWLPQQARSRLFERPVALQQARSSAFERPGGPSPRPPAPRRAQKGLKGVKTRVFMRFHVIWGAFAGAAGPQKGPERHLLRKKM